MLMSRERSENSFLLLLMEYMLTNIETTLRSVGMPTGVSRGAVNESCVAFLNITKRAMATAI